MAASHSEFSTGRCLCMRVRFRVRNPPNYNVVCHCASCKRATGAAFLTASIYPKEALTILHGQPRIQSYEDTSTDSGKPLTRTWCGNCGSPLFDSSALTPSIVSIPAGIMDDGASWAPKVEQYCRSRAHWLPELKGVESFESYPSAEERGMAGGKVEKGEGKEEGKSSEDGGKAS